MRLDLVRPVAGGGRGRRARRTAAATALLLAAALAAGGCSASSSSDSKSASGANAAGSAPRDARRAPDAPAAGKGTTTGAVQEDGSGSGTRAPSSGKGAGTAPRPAATYLVRTADLNVRTPHVADALQRARTLAASAGGYSGDENTAVDSAGHTTSTVQLRVPPAAYDAVLDDLTRLGTLVSRKVSVQDVTGDVVDVQSRVKSQQASVERVRRLMQQATALSDVVSLESELSSREAALESLEAQQASLAEQTNLATISLTLSEPPVKVVAKPREAGHADGFWTRVGHALRDGWHALYLAVRTVLVVLSVLLPFLAVALLLFVAYREVRRRWWPRPDPDVRPTRLRAPDGLPRHRQESEAEEQGPPPAG